MSEFDNGLAVKYLVEAQAVVCRYNNGELLPTHQARIRLEINARGLPALAGPHVVPLPT